MLARHMLLSASAVEAASPQKQAANPYTDQGKWQAHAGRSQTNLDEFYRHEEFESAAPQAMAGRLARDVGYILVEG